MTDEDPPRPEEETTKKDLPGKRGPKWYMMNSPATGQAVSCTVFLNHLALMYPREPWQDIAKRAQAMGCPIGDMGIKVAMCNIRRVARAMIDVLGIDIFALAGASHEEEQ